MIIVLTIGSLILALGILVVIFLKKDKPVRREDKADRIMKEIKNSMKVFEFPKAEETNKIESNGKDVIDNTVDIFDGIVKTEKFYASKDAKNYHEKGCLALKRVKKKISGTKTYFESMKKKPCPICMPNK